jgi:hypothetical protein
MTPIGYLAMVADPTPCNPMIDDHMPVFNVPLVTLDVTPAWHRGRTARVDTDKDTIYLEPRR